VRIDNDKVGNVTSGDGNPLAGVKGGTILFKSPLLVAGPEGGRPPEASSWMLR
jgi:hypothetical protein